MEKGSDALDHLSPASLEGVQDYEMEQLSQPNSSDLGAGVESQVQNSDGEVEAKGATASHTKNEVESLLIKPSVAKASEDAE
ncbi:PREDICTED: uncharacterized protein LOC109234015 isoform X2 [Nicotiana attenuata]|nr:PREDICTED: uncharacterized protein LOC109234015 isoform X2 [Nicotiana attenuata]